MASCGAGVSLARSVISDRAAVQSHPGRRADGLMCGEMSREQSFSSPDSPYPNASPPPTSPCFLFTSRLPLHLPYLLLSPLRIFSSISPPLVSPLSRSPPPRWLCPGAAEVRLLHGRPDQTSSPRCSAASQACTTRKSAHSCSAVQSDALMEAEWQRTG